MTNKQIKKLHKRFPCRKCIVLVMCKGKYQYKDIIFCESLYRWVLKFPFDYYVQWKQIHKNYPHARAISGKK
jgi:hypothetical protein